MRFLRLPALWASPLLTTALLLAAWPAAGHAAEFKQPCRGLQIRDYKGQPVPPYIGSVVVMVRWKELETADQTFNGPGWDMIDDAIEKGVPIRLRINAGIHAPSFVKRMGGPAIPDPEHGIACEDGGIAVWNRHDKTGGSIPRFWLPEVLDQYEQLMAEVARRYDNTPEIREVVASGCMTVYAEPFYRVHGEPGGNKRLFEAGLTFEKDRAAHRRVIEIHHQLFKRTCTSLAVNAWDMIDDSPAHRTSSFEPTYEFAVWARQLMGRALVLQNNGTGLDANPRAGTPRTNHFAFLKQIEGPKGFQTRTLERLGGSREGVIKAIEIALAMGADFVELPAGFQRVVTPDVLAKYNARFRPEAR